MNADEPKSIGRRIKSFRREKDLSTQALADRAGCSAEYLEWIENDQVEPPVSLLIQLAKSLQLDSGAFLAFDGSLGQRQDEAAKRTKHYSYQTLTPSEDDKHLMAFQVTIPPETAHDGVGYKHPGEEFIYVISGEVEVTVDREKRKLTKRQSYRFNSNLDHHLANPGDSEAELLVILYIP